jgi:hypothetical protein
MCYAHTAQLGYVFYIVKVSISNIRTQFFKQMSRHGVDLGAELHRE